MKCFCFIYLLINVLALPANGIVVIVIIIVHWSLWSLCWKNQNNERKSKMKETYLQTMKFNKSNSVSALQLYDTDIGSNLF